MKKPSRFICILANPTYRFLRESRGIKGDKGGLTVGRRGVGRWVVGKSKPTKDEWVWPRGGSPADWSRHSNAATPGTTYPPLQYLYASTLTLVFLDRFIFSPGSPISFSGQEGWLVSCRPPVYPFVHPLIQTKR